MAYKNDVVKALPEDRIDDIIDVGRQSNRRRSEMDTLTEARQRRAVDAVAPAGEE
jgi:hypothetical protein